MDSPIDASVLVIGLRTDDDSRCATTWSPSPALSWRLAAERRDVIQHAYEIAIARDPAFSGHVCSTGRVRERSPISAPWPARPLSSREAVWARVRVWTDQGLTAWSEPLRIEGGLFKAEDWIARPVSPNFNSDRADPLPVPLVRRTITIDRPVRRARIFVTGFGVHDMTINGSPVSDALLEPGWTEYGQRLLFACHDVTQHMRLGENVLASAIADGWWRGYLTWTMRRAVYGATTALLAQLEIDYCDGTRQVIGTDAAWRGATGELRSADIYNGCERDLRQDQPGWREPGFDESDWMSVDVLPLPAHLEQRRIPPARVVQRFPVEWHECENGLRIDCGQNLTGHLRLTLHSAATATVAVRHAEVLEPDGSLHTASLRLARATDIYHLSAGDHVLEPSFTYHGFRYAEIDLPAGVEMVAIEACVVTSDLDDTGHFRCSDERVNRLFENVRWSQRGNFISIPTDCPQRDERLGWTGDIQVFAPTACTNFDARAFLSSWLDDLAFAQRADGNVTSVVPNVIQGHEFEYGGIGWGDAATLVPWALWEAYGDRALLARHFSSMQRWVDYGASRLSSDGVWVGDFHLGDWLDPGAPVDRPHEATTERDFIASSYLAKSASVLSKAAAILGFDEAAKAYTALSERVAKATWNRWRNAAVHTQAGCAIAIAFEIVPAEQISEVGRRLADLVRTNGGRIATGFLGTPLVLPALTSAGQHAAACQLLMNTEAPGWLYQVLRGATTMWERWDAIQSDGRIHAGEMAAEDAASMISFNHYAYGSVGAWLYRTMAGLAPDESEPGYGLIRFAPQPGGGLSWAEAAVETPYGHAETRWDVTGDRLVVKPVVPPGARGLFVPPCGWMAAGGETELHLGSGHHRIELARRAD